MLASWFDLPRSWPDKGGYVSINRLNASRFAYHVISVDYLGCPDALRRAFDLLARVYGLLARLRLATPSLSTTYEPDLDG